MKKTFKSFVYIVACVAVFLVLAKVYTNSFASNSASAFEWEKTVNVYFVDSKKVETASCEADVVLERTVLNAETLGPGAIEALIKGLTSDELTTYQTAINPKTLLQKFEIRGKVAYIDFDSALNSGIAGSCNVIAIRSQIENTLNALPDIDSVVISVNGETEGILEP